MHAVDATTGHVLWANGSELTGPVLAAPIVANGILLVGAYDEQLHAWGP